MTNLVILGNDKIGGSAYEKLLLFQNLDIVIDRSANLNRILTLIKKKRIRLGLVFKMCWSEFVRKGCKPPRNIKSIRSNADLQQQINQAAYEKIYLFRAGLIVSNSLIRTGVQIMNIHAAKVPEYGGIGSIDRALNDLSLNQFASLHIVTSKIDEGQVLEREAYILDPQKSYFKNEEIAYTAAISLLFRTIEKSFLKP